VFNGLLRPPVKCGYVHADVERINCGEILQRLSASVIGRVKVRESVSNLYSAL